MHRAIAGFFAGCGGLLSLYLGVTTENDVLITGGLLLLTNMFTFFVGEVNGQRKTS